jgi:uncharacterized protein (TIRG00374 family)
MPSFKNSLFFLITLTLGVLFFLIISGRVDWGDVTESLSLVRSWQFAMLFLFMLALEACAVFAWQKVLRYMGYKLPWRKLWRILVVGFTVSFLTPIAFIGGEALVLYLLKRELKVPWHRGINSLIVLKLADFMTHTFFIFTGIVVFMILTGFASIELISFFTIAPIILSVFLVYFFIRASRKKSVINPILRLLGLSKTIRNNKSFDLAKEEGEIISFFNLKNKKSWWLLGVTFIKYLVSWAQALVLLFFLTNKIAIFPSLAVHAFSGLSIMFFLPAGLGSLELLQVVAFSGLGFSGGSAVSFSLIWRGMRLLLCALSIGYFFFFAGRIIENKITNLIGRVKKYSKNKNPGA